MTEIETTNDDGDVVKGEFPLSDGDRIAALELKLEALIEELKRHVSLRLPE